MRTLAAVFRTRGLPAPYARSRPLEVEEVELDPPGPGELLIRIDAAGVCHTDLSIVDGTRVRPLPIVPGHEACGTVLELGPGARDVAVDDRVVLTFVPSCGACAECTAGHPARCPSALRANGAGELLGGGTRLRDATGPIRHFGGVSAFASHVVVSRGSAVVIDRDVDPAVAALFGCAVLTGVGAVLTTAGVRPGESVAIFGLGGVGLAAVMGAALAGAHPVIGIDPIAAKRERALQVGATTVLDPGSTGALADLPGGGVDWAFEATGRNGVLAAAYEATKRGGTTVMIGLPSADDRFDVSALSFVDRARTVVGSYMGSSVPQRDIPRFIALWRAGRLPVDRLLDGEVPLEAVNQALDDLRTGAVVRQVLRPGANG